MIPQQGQPPITPQMMQQFMQQSGGQPPSPPPQSGGMPPQGMGAFQQAAGGQQPPRPPMPPQGAPPQAGGQPPPMNPAVIMQMIDTLPPQVKQMIAQHIMQNAAQQGRGGDTMLAHLTPGEKTVPPEVQTPKVLATLDKAYKDKGVQPQQFTAGTPQSSKNPSTGLPEYNFMSAFLPAALGMAGAVAAPFTGGASLGLSEAAMAAIGGGLGSAAGGLMVGQTPTQAALSGIGSAAGGYALGGLGGTAADTAGSAAASSAPTAAQTAVLGAKDVPGAMTAAQQMGLNTASKAAAPSLSWGQTMGNSISNGLGLPSSAMATLGTPAANGAAAIPAQAGWINPLATAGSALGGYMGGSLGATPKSNGPAYPPGFNTPMHPVGSQGSAQQQLGQTNSVQPRPNFTGFNPMTNYPAAYNFFPQGG